MNNNENLGLELLEELRKLSGICNEEKVLALIAGGASLTEIDDDGAGPLSVAAQFGHVNIMKVLLDKGVNIEAQDWSGGTALHHAAVRGQAAAVRFLLSRGARADARTRDGRTPLDLARLGNEREELAAAELLVRRLAKEKALARISDGTRHDMKAAKPLALRHGKKPPGF